MSLAEELLKRTTERRFMNPQRRNGDYKTASFNLEYELFVSQRGTFTTERAGMLGTTSTECKYEVKGRVYFVPLDQNERERKFDNHDLRIEHRDPTTKETKYKNIILDGDDLSLEQFCERNFPYMGIIGKITVNAENPFPVDISREEYVGIILDAIKKTTGFDQLAKAHKAFLDCYPKQKAYT